jgi:transposase-like protein
VTELCRKHGVAQSTYYKWKSKYGGMEASDLSRLKALEEENRKLKKLFAEPAPRTFDGTLKCKRLLVNGLYERQFVFWTPI